MILINFIVYLKLIGTYGKYKLVWGYDEEIVNRKTPCCRTNDEKSL
jgi:hypothetical protein